MSEPISVALLRVGSRFLDNKQSRLLLNWPDFRLQCGEGPGQNRCYKNQIIWCFIQLFKHTFVFVWETENVCPIISEADHEYRVIKAILLCRFCTYPLLPEHLIPSSVVLTVTPFFSMCNGPPSSDKDSYFVQSHTYYTLRVRQRAYPIADLLKTMRTNSATTHAFLCSCVDSWTCVSQCIENVLIQYAWWLSSHGIDFYCSSPHYYYYLLAL